MADKPDEPMSQAELDGLLTGLDDESEGPELISFDTIKGSEGIWIVLDWDDERKNDILDRLDRLGLKDGFVQTLDADLAGFTKDDFKNAGHEGAKIAVGSGPHIALWDICDFLVGIEDKSSELTSEEMIGAKVEIDKEMSFRDKVHTCRQYIEDIEEKKKEAGDAGTEKEVDAENEEYDFDDRPLIDLSDDAESADDAGRKSAVITEESLDEPSPDDEEFPRRIEEHAGGYNYLMAHVLDTFGKVFGSTAVGHEYDRIDVTKQDEEDDGDEVELGTEKYIMGNSSEFKVDGKFTLSGHNVPESERTRSGEEPMASLNIEHKSADAMTSNVALASLNAAVFHMAEQVGGDEKFDIAFNTATDEGRFQFVKAFAEMRWAQEDYANAATPEERAALVKFNEHSERIGEFNVNGVKIPADALVGLDPEYKDVDKIVDAIKRQEAANRRRGRTMPFDLLEAMGIGIRTI
jgi:hypothetical protein